MDREIVEQDYKIAVTGIVSKEKNMAVPFVLDNLYNKNTVNGVRVITDNTPFARKRLVNPKSVYSGLFDVLEFTEADSIPSLETAIEGCDSWLACNVPSSDLKAMADIAVKAGLKRVVFGVLVTEEEARQFIDDASRSFDDVRVALETAKIDYTIVKHEAVMDMGESKQPFRVVRDQQGLPLIKKNPMASGDLYRILAECVDLPKTFNSAYGVGPGTVLDQEILIYMKSKGWPERVQVGLLMGDMMEKIEKKFMIAQKQQTEIDEKAKAERRSEIS